MNFKKLVGLFFLMILLHSCYNDCSDFECAGAPTFKFQLESIDSSEVVDSLIKITRQGDIITPTLLSDNQMNVEVKLSSVTKNITVFKDSLSVFYNDSLQSKVFLDITKTKGTCCDVFKLSRVVIEDSVFCTSNCTNRVYEVRF